MSKKPSPKAFAQSCRKLVVLCDLLIDTVYEIEKSGHDEKDFIAELKNVRSKCEATLKAAYSVESVEKSTYIGDLSKQIDTLIRKNFEIS